MNALVKQNASGEYLVAQTRSDSHTRLNSVLLTVVRLQNETHNHSDKLDTKGFALFLFGDTDLLNTEYQLTSPLPLTYSIVPFRGVRSLSVLNQSTFELLVDL